MDTCGLPLLRKIHTKGGERSLREQLGQWITRMGCLATPSPPIPDPLPSWHTITVHLPLLAKVATAMYGITPSKAAVERSFSHQSLVHSERRASLDDRSVASTMMVRMNLTLVYDLPGMPQYKKPRLE